MSTREPTSRDLTEFGESIPRFSTAVRWVHGLTGALMLVCILTAVVLYNGTFANLIGHRFVVETIHVYAGFALPVPPLLGLVARSYRSDVGLLNRFTAVDRTWLRRRDRRTAKLEVGKFNAGQKLNAALSAGSIGVLLGSGVVMYFTGLTALAYRSGATFVHDWFALGLGLLVVGHLSYAIRDPHAMAGIRSGRVALRWARREHPAWAREMAGDPPDQP